MLAVVALSTCFACSGGGEGTASSCAALATCCASLDGPAAQACNSYVEASVTEACAADLLTLQQADDCTAVADGPSGPASSPSAVCSLYVNCMGIVEPSGQAAILAAYGPSGSCWQTSATAAECGTACAAGLATEREDSAHDRSCPLCQSDLDCSGAAPVCDGNSCVCISTGQSCTSGTSCCTGYCPANGACGCPDEQTVCGTRCVDMQTDAFNCGGCGTTCAQGTACAGGVCSCPIAGESVCDTGCVDLRSDSNNCGSCDMTCDTSCSGGICTCPTDYATMCDGQCVDLQSDTDNCGACGVECSGSASGCTSGQCTTIITAMEVNTETCASSCAGLGAGFACATATFEYYQNGDFCAETNPATCGDTGDGAPAVPAACDPSAESGFLTCSCTHS